MALSTPILFCVFNRPEPTARVFAAIREQQPQRLLIVQDGPRAGHAEDEINIALVRRIVTQIDWPCQLETQFASCNLGCKRRMASGISWGFQRADRLVILEDDCLPARDFFPFCEALLERHAADSNVLMISGDQFQAQRPTAAPYYFSKYAHIWGWASWRRAWALYDCQMRDWPAFRNSAQFGELCPEPDEQAYWRMQLDRQVAGEIDSWDFPWMFTGWMHKAWTVLPAVNLVSNIGFGAGATHTIQSDSPLANMATGDLPASEIADWHPRIPIHTDGAADRWTWRHVFGREREFAAPLGRRIPTRRWWRRWLRRAAVFL
jgi:hypothetical protein